MSDSLLAYFEQELRFIREEAAAFSRRHPGAANALGLNKETVDDPQVARLIESVALLNGKLQKRLDDTYPEFTESLLRLLFPHYLRPVPSFSIMRVGVGEDASAQHVLPRHTEFDVTDESGNDAVFRTTQALTLNPLFLSGFDIAMAPFDIVKPKGAEQSKAMVSFTLTTFDEGTAFSSLDIPHLDMQLQGDPNLMLRFHDMLFAGIEQVVLSWSGGEVVLGSECLEVVGFDNEQSTLPYLASSFFGFKLLTEFFVFPERFHALRIHFSDALKYVDAHEITVNVFIEDVAVDIARALSVDNFELHCTPVVNLQTITAEPTRIDFSQPAYPLILDASRPDALSLFSIEKIEDIDEQSVTFVPELYSDKYHAAKTGYRWQLAERELETGDREYRIKVSDTRNESADSEPRVWIVTTLCTNGRNAARLTTRSKLQCRDTITIPGEPVLSRRPTQPAPKKDLKNSTWVLLSHLHFNYHAIFGAENPVAQLKSLFRLYNHHESQQVNAYINALVSMDTEQVVAPIRVSGKSCFAYGTKVHVTLNPADLVGGVVLFSNLLDRFFACFAGFNSFTQVEVLLEGHDGVFKTFPRRSGCKNLL
ncbi:type VI secretion system baseplate subunit TssF [Enterovibrio sp. ZSDZ35]|uniref:Type VI secretion system baseplate subunit TssF n=1 Tax=Enterovibrio qingdaonensis TaxID=2899818 RepID=A0ABT5QSN1_9GAMM|nr:type VI secretion system baseplate subunit TssF [Enterovibrio sp. ZSDZ35]MDD1783977.1 type VI secretion system baseplate subunit TssF [Enterovibrio sp. ZSDZ35]